MDTLNLVAIGGIIVTLFLIGGVLLFAWLRGGNDE